MAGGYQILTRPVHAAAIERAQFSVRTPKLTAAALETLAVIAYRQPVGRAEIEEIRGVSAGGVLRSLQERGLIEVVGRSEALGRPMLYGTDTDVPRAARAPRPGRPAAVPRSSPSPCSRTGPSPKARTTRPPTSRPSRDRDAAPAGAGPRRSRIAPGRRRADRAGQGPGGRGRRHLGMKVDPDRQRITVSGRAVKQKPRRWLAFHKPMGVVTTADDEEGRRTVFDFIPDAPGADLRGTARREDHRPPAPHHRWRRRAPAHPSTVPHHPPLHRAGAWPPDGGDRRGGASARRWWTAGRWSPAR